MTTRQPDQDSTTTNEINQPYRQEKHMSPLAHGVILLCLYIVMYLAVAALLHNVATLSTAMVAIESSLANAEHALAADADDPAMDVGGRHLARAGAVAIDPNAD